MLFYVFHVVLEAFRQAEPRPKRVSRRRVEEQLAAIEFTGLPLSSTNEDFETSEPHVLRYVTEALAEEDDPLLTVEEFQSCLETLWVVIECLHAACRRRYRPCRRRARGRHRHPGRFHGPWGRAGR
ncbi:MAG: hypothetical protein U5R48_04225 [Gammaproteobacteria bacterium]|nr:hypothetical protein [Gammaproteobacteria bacterium]